MKRIHWLINHKKKGGYSEALAKDMKLSKRRVEHIWKEYRETGKAPVVGKNPGRPEKPITKDEAEAIKQAFDRYKFGARMLEPFIKGFYNIHVPHNRLHTLKIQ